MTKTVAVLMGGWSPEREVALSSGRECAKALVDCGYKVQLIDVAHDLPALMQTEVNQLVDAIIWDGDGKISTLLTAPFTFVNGRLASFYGISGPTGQAFQRVALAPVGTSRWDRGVGP